MVAGKGDGERKKLTLRMRRCEGRWRLYRARRAESAPSLSLTRNHREEGACAAADLPVRADEHSKRRSMRTGARGGGEGGWYILLLLLLLLATALRRCILLLLLLVATAL